MTSLIILIIIFFILYSIFSDVPTTHQDPKKPLESDNARIPDKKVETTNLSRSGIGASGSVVNNVPKTLPKQVNANRTFYHFTHPRNLPSIKRYGLLSWKELENRGLTYIRASSDLSHKLDKQRRLENYVRLALNCRHPMAWRAVSENRVDRLVWIEIDSSVLDLPGNLYSDDNATSNRANIDSNPQTALNSASNQAEILVLKQIPPQYIKIR